MIDSVKQADPDVLILDGGDTGESMSQRRGWVTPFIWSVMEEMGYDVIAVGKRDFADTSAIFLKQHGENGTTYLTGNIADSSKKFIGKPYQILKKGGLKIGVVSAISENYGGYFVHHVLNPSVETILNAQEQFRKEKVDFSILIYSGRSSEMIDFSSTLDGFDVIFQGNSSGRPMSSTLEGVKIPMVGPGDRGREVAVVTLTKSNREEPAAVSSEEIILFPRIEDSPKYEPFNKKFMEMTQEQNAAERAARMKRMQQNQQNQSQESDEN